MSDRKDNHKSQDSAATALGGFYASAVPHLIALIVAVSPLDVLDTLRCVSRELRRLADQEQIRRHVVVGHAAPGAVGPTGDTPKLLEVKGSALSESDVAGSPGAVWTYQRPGRLVNVHALAPIIAQTRVLTFSIDYTKLPVIDRSYLPVGFPGTEEEWAPRLRLAAAQSLYSEHSNTNLLGLGLLDTAHMPNLRIVRAVSPTVLCPVLRPRAATFIYFSHMCVRDHPLPQHIADLPLVSSIEREWLARLRRPFWELPSSRGASRFVVNFRIPKAHGPWETEARIGGALADDKDLRDVVAIFAADAPPEPVHIAHVGNYHPGLGSGHSYNDASRPGRPTLPQEHLGCGMLSTFLDFVTQGIARPAPAVRFTLVGLGELACHSPFSLGFHPPLTYGNAQIAQHILEALGHYLEQGFSRAPCRMQVPPVARELIPGLLDNVKFVSHDEYRNGVDPWEYDLETVE